MPGQPGPLPRPDPNRLTPRSRKRYISVMGLKVRTFDSDDSEFAQSEKPSNSDRSIKYGPGEVRPKPLMWEDIKHQEWAFHQPKDQAVR